jgi:hypothetical protein
MLKQWFDFVGGAEVEWAFRVTGQVHLLLISNADG